MINVTKTFLPPLEEYEHYLRKIWKSNQVANGGELWMELHDKLKEYLGVENLILTTNATLGLQIALKALAGNGEVITTPFSYVATTSAIVWEGCKPVFVDIDPENLNLDAQKIEAAITPNTTAILATHVFGNPCDVEAIAAIAKKHNLKVIYDAAHCFGVKYKGESIFNYGDISICSFHATKIFHTGEGGAIFCQDEAIYKQLFTSHNFGHQGPLAITGLGINAKMSELQAGMGLAVFPYMEQILCSREQIVKTYDENLDFKNSRRPMLRKGASWNYSYYPLIFETEAQLLHVQKKLNKRNIYPRRYFYPSLNTLDYVSYSEMPFSENISKKILCLPLYEGLGETDLHEVIQLINS